MLDKRLVVMKLREFGINFQITPEAEYINFIVASLRNKDVSDEEFVNAVDKILSTTTTTFNKMPNLAMFLEQIPAKKPLTVEVLAKARANELWSWLVKQIYTSSYGEIVWDYYEANKKFEDEAINIMIKAEFGSLKELVLMYKNKFESKELDWFKKDILERFKTQDLVAQKNTIAISEDKKIKSIELISNLVNKLKA